MGAGPHPGHRPGQPLGPRRDPQCGYRGFDLPRTQGLRGAFTKDQAQRFDAKVEMAVEVRNERGFQDGFATATAERFTTVAEDITLNDRDRILFGLVEDLMRELNTRLDANIRSFLAGQLR